MSKVVFYAAQTSATTDVSGLATIRTKIPGTFTSINGFQAPIPDGRFLRKIQLWTDNGVVGDLLDNIRVEDTDTIIQGMSAKFPNYPVIQYLSDQDIISGASSGILIPPTEIIIIDPVDPAADRGFQFIPAEFYLCADFHSGDGSSGKTIRINYLWGKYFNTDIVSS